MSRLATHVLAEQATAVSLSGIPDPVRQTACRALIDTFGVALAGSQTPVVRQLVAIPMTEGKAGILGYQQQVSALEAARVNGCAAHALDFDDNCYAGFVHGSAVIVPAALAVAQQCHCDGETLLASIVAGSECQYRLGEALGRTLYDRGWWTTGVLGVMGAAVAASHLLGLDVSRTAHAIAIALSATGGNKSAFGSDAKPVMAGLAAERGVLTAFMAQAGITGPLNTLEHRYGLPRLMNGSDWQPGRLDASGWRLLSPGLDIKRLPVCLSSHAAVDAAVALVHKHEITLNEIEMIRCDIPPVVAANLVYTSPCTAQEARFSLQYAVAAALYYGELTLSQLTREPLIPGPLQGLMAKVSMVTTSQWEQPERLKSAPEGADVTIYLKDGRQFSKQVDRARGSASLPLNDTELDEKFLACAQAVLSPLQSRRLLKELRAVDSLPSVLELYSTLEIPNHEL